MTERAAAKWLRDLGSFLESIRPEDDGADGKRYAKWEHALAVAESRLTVPDVL